MPDDRNTVRGVLRSFGPAFRGLGIMFQKERNFKVQASLGLLAVMAGFLFEISPVEWLVQLLAIGAVMSLEALNSALERLCDYVEPERRKEIGTIKDVAAGAVLWSSLAAFAIALVIYLPKL